MHRFAATPFGGQAINPSRGAGGWGVSAPKYIAAKLGKRPCGSFVKGTSPSGVTPFYPKPTAQSCQDCTWRCCPSTPARPRPFRTLRWDRFLRFDEPIEARADGGVQVVGELAVA